MARDPDERFESAAALRAALLAAGATTTGESDLTATTFTPRVDATTAAGRPVEPAPPADAGPSFRQTERSWLIPTVIVVMVAIALGVAGLLFDRSGAGDLLGDVREAIGGRAPAAPVAITAVRAFDPPCDASLCEPGQRGGDGRENDDDAPLAADGDPQTSWRSEGYDHRDITLLKPGVGLVLQLEAAKDLTSLEVESPRSGWKALVYVADTDPGTLAGWGEPVATTDALAAETSEIDLGGARGAAVLLWIVDRGDFDGRAPAEISEVRVSGR
jgi:hypothetical protein